MCKMWNGKLRQQPRQSTANREPTTDKTDTKQQMLNILQNVKHKESKQSETTKQKSP